MYVSFSFMQACYICCVNFATFQGKDLVFDLKNVYRYTLSTCIIGLLDRCHNRAIIRLRNTWYMYIPVHLKMNKFQCLLYVYQSRHRCNGNSRLEDSDTESPSSHCRCISCPSQSTKSTPRTPTQTPENIIVKDSLPTYNNCDTEK